jgi:tetratricopeptide (TPR) repeat protein
MFAPGFCFAAEIPNSPWPAAISSILAPEPTRTSFAAPSATGYDREIDDLFAVQAEIARAVSVALQVRILDPRLGSDSSHFRRNPAAYEPYLQAQYFLARGEDKDDLEKALGYVDQAIQLDPGFAPSWALRSLVINTAATIGLSDHEKSFLEARENAEKAIALDAQSAAGYLALGWVKLGYEWDWDGADAALKKAADLQPGSAVVLSYRAYLYECLGRLDEAIALTQEASILDPLRTNAYLGALLLTAGRYDEAKASVEKALSMNQKLEGAHARLGAILLAQGQAQAALAEMNAEPGEWEKLTGLALVYYALGRTHDSDAALSRLIATHAEDSPYQIAEIYAYRGEVDQAFAWLKRSYVKRDPGLNQLKLDPLLKNLRTDPRYFDLLKKMRLRA